MRSENRMETGSTPGTLIVVDGKAQRWYGERMKKSDSFVDRRQESEAAKRARVEKFKSRPDQASPEAAERAVARQAQNVARLERKAAADLEKRNAAEKIKAEAAVAAEGRRLAESQELKRTTEAAAAQSVLDEASRKAKRDARYANRKARS
jgi:hypothetical protein